MGKMNELSALADEIREMGEKLTRMSGQIRDLFTEQEDVAQESTQVPVDTPAVTLEEVRAVLARKTRVSKENTEAIRELLKKHGAERLSQIPQEEYAAVLKEAEVIPDA